MLRRFAKLKNALMPYLYVQAIEARTTGLPLLRAMFVEFPDDRVCQTLDLQYMLRDTLLVAPIFNEVGRADFYVPKERWVGLLDGKVTDGPMWFTESFDYLHLPRLVSEDRVVLVGREDRLDYDWKAVLKIVVGYYKKRTLEVSVPGFERPGEMDVVVKISEIRGSERFKVSSGYGADADVVMLGEMEH